MKENIENILKYLLKVLTKSELRIYFTLSLLLLLVTYPRFDKQDKLGVKNYSYKERTGEKDTIATFSDDIAYVDIVKKYRGDNEVIYAQAPYTYRPTALYIASFLPFKALTSINILNIISHLLSLLIYIKVLKLFKISLKYIFLTLLFYIVSFPIFYYSTIGLIDPVIQFSFSLVLYLILKEELLLAILVYSISISIKESIILVVPLISLYYYYKEICKINSSNLILTKQNFNFIKLPLAKSLILSFSLFLIYSLVIYICRHYTLDPNPNWKWVGGWDNFVFNITRFRAIFSSVMSFGLIGLFALFSINLLYKNKIVTINNILFTNEYKHFNYLLISIISYFAFIIYAYAYARVTGNHFLPLFTFTIPLAAYYLQNKFELNNHKINSNKN